ncbi:uncharacterized protein LOC119765169 isoform X2 [Culex quinquefasciatus]|uniref:uncharacterized protein LOC119765160 isoform X2 n=1 Tax=Culex quinquefasciatus TaxID=7176 RepID=UPI0018E3614D|nr:uncharacterized protein LOC119765160 isoform X2 [Culex quinquefasciatus]XP_038104420.1 uncharacterized protein LOC119765160 isoform X2 [Culex quinquefasciatus]XP_038104442.1 uncharacterized protein LOC119765169 isoform X2 [Culex quinquefasciatus]
MILRNQSCERQVYKLDLAFRTCKGRRFNSASKRAFSKQAGLASAQLHHRMHEVLFFGGHGVQIRRCRTCWNDHRRLGKPGAHHRHRTQVVQLPRGQETNLAFTPVQNLLDQSAYMIIRC